MRSLGFLFLVFSSISLRATDTYPKNPDVDVQHYRFELVLSDATDEIKASAEVDVLFLKNGTAQFRLDLTNVSADGKGMTVEGVQQDGKPVQFTHANNELVLLLPAIAEKGQHQKFIIAYHGVPAKGLQMNKNKYQERTFFSDNWPDLTRNWLPVVDHPSDKATSEFIVTAPIRYQVVSNGLKLEESYVSETQKKTHWKQSVPIASWLYVLGVAEFAVEYVDLFDGKSIQTWVFHQDRDAGFSDFQKPTKEVLDFFSSYVGPFAYEKLANIQASSVAGGMEASSAILYNEKCVTGDGSPRWKKVVIHEIAHQWFGCAVTEKDWDDVWLSEGFATYFTALFIEHSEGRDAFVNELKGARDQVYSFYQKNPDHTIVHQNLADMSKVTSTHTYQKGAWTLHMLRTLIGDAAFEKGIRNYYQRYFNRNASTADFQAEMENVSGRDLTAFFKQWLNQGGFLSLSGSWHYNLKTKKLEVTLVQIQKDGTSFSVPVELGILTKDKLLPEIVKIELVPGVTRYDVPLDYVPSTVVIDPRTVLLGKWAFGMN